MIDQINSSLSFQSEALKLRSQRQQLLAANIANSDTPNYKARDFDFARSLTDATRSDALVSTKARDFDFARSLTDATRSATPAVGRAFSPATIAVRERSDGKQSLDGNTVDLDIERVQFADNALRYEATLRFINGKLRTLLSAIQG